MFATRPTLYGARHAISAGHYLAAATDVEVLHAYGRDDLAEAAAPEYVTKDNEADQRYQGRLFWSAPFRDRVPSRLLELNADRAAEERRLGLTSLPAEAEEELEEAEAE